MFFIGWPGHIFFPENKKQKKRNWKKLLKNSSRNSFNRSKMDLLVKYNLIWLFNFYCMKNSVISKWKLRAAVAAEEKILYFLLIIIINT